MSNMEDKEKNPQSAQQAQELFDRAHKLYNQDDFAASIPLFREAADLGHARAQFYMGYLHDTGKGVEKNYDEAIRWYRMAAEKGYSNAWYNLGLLYDDGEGVTQDKAQAAEYYHSAAELGLAKAMFSLALMYDNGTGVEQNYAEAVRWYRAAAEKGHAKAQNNLGNRYKKGKGVERNYAEAARWYRSAAEQGNKLAQRSLAELYKKGQGVEANPAEAARWYRAAAEQGDEKAMLNLASMYLQGEGVNKDLSEAERWAQAASQAGHADAAGLLEKIRAEREQEPAPQPEPEPAPEPQPQPAPTAPAPTPQPEPEQKPKPKPQPQDKAEQPASAKAARSKKKYYSIPRKILNPRAVHLYDIVAMVLVFVLALKVLPLGTTLDFSAGFNRKSESYLAYETEVRTERLATRGVDRYFFEDYFETTTVQNGDTLYQLDKKLYFYRDGEQGRTYYPQDTGGEKPPQALTGGEGDLPTGMIGSHFYLTVAEDGRIYYDDLEGQYGWTDCYVDVEGADLTEVCKLLCSGETIPLEQAALIWSLIRQGTLVGFCDGTAWFRVNEDGNDHIYRGTDKGLEEVYVIEGEASHVMVAFNDLLFYLNQAGDLYARNLETLEGTYFPYSTDWSNFGQVLQIAYVKCSNGYIRLYALNSITSVYTDFTGNGVEMDTPTWINATTDKHYSAIATTQSGKQFTLWVRDGEQWIDLKTEG